VHPDENRQDYEKRLLPYASVIHIVDNRSLKLSDYSLMIGMYSSLMIHAMLTHVDVVSFQPGAFGPDICHLSAQGLVKRMTSVEELAHFLAEMEAVGNRAAHHKSAALNAAIRGSCDRLENFLLT
jgi:hypothetical protein